jgi:hydroxymethylpyrimidine pyrophosphatase-like HAD family hydrolase
MIFGIDFDGTIVEANYPNIGALKPNAKKIINQLFDEGHEIIINTCRAGIYEGEAYKFLEENGIQYTFVNSNLPRLIEEFRQDCRKISADLYIDDKQLGGIPDDWDEIYELIQEHPKYNIITYGK